MEENVQSTTMNLNNLNNGVVNNIPNNTVVAPISSGIGINTNPQMTTSGFTETIVSTTIPAQTIPAQTIPAQNVPMQNMHSQVIQQQPIQNQEVQQNTTNVDVTAQIHSGSSDENANKEDTELIENKEQDKFTLSTSRINNIMNNINKAITFDNRNNLSTSTQLKFTTDGLEVIAGDNEVFIIQKDKYTICSDAICTSVGLPSEKFKALISKITDKKFDLIIDRNTHFITIKTVNGDYLLPEKYDNQTSESLNIPVPQSVFASQKIAIGDVNDVRSKVRALIPFAATTDAYPYCRGVYFEDDTINTTDANNFGIVKNFTAFNRNTLFLPIQFMKAFSELDFDPASAQLGFVTEEGFTKPNKVIIQADNITLVGNAMAEQDYNDFPISIIKDFNKTTYGNRILINREALVALLDRILLFVNEKDDGGVVELDFDNLNITVKSLQGFGQEKIFVQNSSNQINPIQLDTKALTTAIKNLGETNIYLQVDNNVPNMISLYGDTFEITMAQAGREN